MGQNTLHLSLKDSEQYGKLPKIVVMGVGGGGCNAVNNMMNKKIDGVEFVSVNTDVQSLSHSNAHKIIQLGKTTTKGQGAGSYPEIGLSSAEESREEIEEVLQDVQLLFLTAGMGGGTGTGATPYIAKLAREKDILIVAVVTKPFKYEAEIRSKLAEQGIAELKKYADTIIVLPNENLFRIANKETTLQDAFMCSDNVLYLGVKGITDLITTPGLINLDFADVRMVIKKMGRAMMGMGEAEGENRSIRAVEEALSNPLLEDVNIKGATGALVNITGSPDMTLFEFDEAAKRIREEIGGNNAVIKVGTAFMKELQGKVRVSIFATGMKDSDENNNIFDEANYAEKNENNENTNENAKNKINDLFSIDKIKKEKFDSEPSFKVIVEEVRVAKSELNDNERMNIIPGKTRINSKNNGDFFDMGTPAIEEVIDDDRKNSFSFFGLFSNSQKKNINSKGANKNNSETNTFKSKNREIEIKNNSITDRLDDELLSVPAYLRNKQN